MGFVIKSPASVVICSAAWFSAILGCSGGTDVSSVSAAEGTRQAGTLQIPLTATAPSGTVYRLKNAVFQIENPFAVPPVSLSVKADDDALTVDLPPSVFDFDYQVFLQDGWELHEVGAGGAERTVNAELISGNPANFTIRAQRTTPLTYQFRANSSVVTTGDGALAISVVVDDSLIDDLEDGDGHLLAIGGRNGTWFTFNDGSGVQTPAPEAEVLPEVLDASANFVLHTSGSGFSPARPLPNGTFAFGAGVGANLSVDPVTDVAKPYDASGYAGIGFSFSISFPSATPVQLSFLVGTRATTPVAEGGTCTEGCFDDFAFVGGIPFSPFSFSGVIPYEALAQQGFGTPVAFDPATLMNVKWIIAFPDVGQPSVADRFDFQLDDVTFATADQAASRAVVASTPTDAPPLALPSLAESAPPTTPGWR